jgi:hypothetical protein
MIRLRSIRRVEVDVAECAPGVTRTPGLRIRNPLLYPAELRALFIGKSRHRKRFLPFSRCASSVGLVKRPKPKKTWAKTRLQNLLRHKSGRYYARAFAGGKEVWKSLKTSHFSVAEAKLATFLKEHREQRSNGNGEVSAKMTFSEPLAFTWGISMITWASNRVRGTTGARFLPL